MDTMQAFAMGQANRGKPVMVFDWEEAARRIKASGSQFAQAGLASDWEWTGGTIYENGQPVMDSYTYLASTWATPELDLGTGPEPCFRMAYDTPGWDANTKWPEEARKILLTA